VGVNCAIVGPRYRVVTGTRLNEAVGFNLSAIHRESGIADVMLAAG